MTSNRRQWDVQVRALMTIGNWRSLAPSSFEFGFGKYRKDYLVINGREYRAPWRIVCDGEVVHQHDGSWSGGL